MTRLFSNLLVPILTTACLTAGHAAADVGDTDAAVQQRSWDTAAVAPVWAGFDEAERVYNEAIRAGIAIEDRVLELKADTNGSELERAGRLYLASLLQWRHGLGGDALASVREALEMGRYGELLRHQGRLLDAAGDGNGAAQSYREAIPLLSGEARLDTELRLALLIAGDNNDVEPLLSLAERGDDALRNRIAMALAVLGHLGDAIGLYALPPDASDEQRLRYYLRLTEWALWNLDLPKAREAVWQALRLPGTQQDRLYALALLSESHRLDDSLPELVEKLEAEQNLGDDARSLWVSLLREIDRPDAALAALTGRAEEEPRDVKRQLVGLYREANRSAELAAELERLMLVDSDETIWPRSLAEFYLERNERQAAERAWRDFIDRCDTSRALLFGAQAMQQLDFDELALQAAKKAQRDAAAVNSAALFRFELHFERGRYDRAGEVLEELDDAVGAADPVRKTLAMSYERLGRPREALETMRAFVNASGGRDIAAGQYLAHLLFSVGKPDKAVDKLMALLPHAAAPQRRLIQTRVIAAARMAGIGDELAAELTEKLRNGSAAEAETQLLIEMRIRANEEEEALSLIDTLYDKPGADPVEKLKELAVLHRSLGNWRAYDDTLAQLAEHDPDKAIFHIRGRIINYIDNLRPEAASNTEVHVTLLRLLQDYAAVSSGGADREFLAGVLAMAGLHPQALAAFREVVAVDPSRLDSYQGIGNQLLAMGQKAQAVTMYQYLAESTSSESVFQLVLDSILNTVPDSHVLKWAQRMALERLTGKPDKLDYYLQLSDISADLGQSELQFSVLHNALAAEPELRLSTLRELLRMTAAGDTGRPGFGGRNMSLSEQHVFFGRRLLALGLAMPPDVYLALARAMMEAGETGAALQAVTQAVEHTGSGELLVQAADIFQQAGEDLAAHRLYEKALVNDPANFELLVQVGWSSVRLGQNDRATELFLNALIALLQRQPLRNEALLVFTGLNQPPRSLDERRLEKVLLDEGREVFPKGQHSARTHSMEYRQYYIPLRNGLVYLMSGEPQRRGAVFDRLWDEYHSTLAAVRVQHSTLPDLAEFPSRESQLPRLANYPRLNLQAQLLRYLGYAFGDYDSVSKLDTMLLTQFPEDAQLPAILASHRAEWSSVGYLDWLDDADFLTDAQRRQLREQWLATGTSADEGTSVVKVSGGGDPSSAGSLAAMKNELNRALRAEDLPTAVNVAKRLVETETGLIWTTLQEIELQLPPAEKRAVARHAFAVLGGDREKAAYSLRIGSYPYPDLKRRRQSWAARLSAWSGDKGFEDSLLLDIVTEPASEQSGELQPWAFDLWFVYQSLSRVNRQKWLEQLAQDESPGAADQLLTLTASALEAEPNDDTARLLKSAMANHQTFAEPRKIPMVLNTVDIHPGNTKLAREIVEIIQRRYVGSIPEFIFEPNLLRAEGRVDAALNKLVHVFFDGQFPSTVADPWLEAKTLLGRYQTLLVNGNEFELIDILNSLNLSSPGKVQKREDWLLQLLLSVHTGLSDPERLLQVVLDFLHSDPSDIAAVRASVRAAELYVQTGQDFAAQEFLGQLAGHVPSAQPMVVDNSLQSDHPVNALAAYNKSPGQLHLVPQTLQALVPQTFQAIESSGPAGLDAIRRALTGDDHARLKREMTRLWQMVQPGESPLPMKNSAIGSGVSLKALTELPLNRDQTIFNTMRALYQGRQLRQRAELVRMLPVLVEHPLGVEILKVWLKSVRGRMLDQAQGLVDALADAHVHHGSAAARFAELTADIRERRAGDKELGLWLAIGSRVPELAASNELGSLLPGCVQPQSAYRPSLLIGTARFLAGQGDNNGALKCLQSLAHRLRTSGFPFRDNDISLHAILTTAGEVLDARTHQVLLRGELAAVKPWKEHLVASYSEFVLTQFDAAKDQQAFYRAFKAEMDDALANLVGKRTGTGSTQSVLLTRVAAAQLSLGKKLAALNSLKMAMGAMVEERKRTRIASVSAQIASENGKYRELLGLDAAAGNLWLITVMRAATTNGGSFGSVFSSADLPWLKQAESRVRDWIDNKQVDRNVAVEALLDISREYHKAGAEAEVDGLFAYLKTQLAHKGEMALNTVVAMFATAEELDRNLGNLQLEKELLFKGMVEHERMAAVLKRVAHVEGDAEALRFGSSLLEFTLNDDLLGVLIALAEKHDQSDRARQWRELRDEAREARKQLRRMKMPI